MPSGKVCRFSIVSTRLTPSCLTRVQVCNYNIKCKNVTYSLAKETYI